ncbi:MAG: hypothetical protein R3240_09975 [Gammaproteobacteria bacterium]|nr:hypothetical protein [Gammaproteobacteria bacterium]
MQIDWFTVGAQVVNFLVLVALLKRFLYQPITNAMARREESILQSKLEAEQQSADAQKEIAFYQEKLQEIEQQRQEVLTQAWQEADVEKEKLVEQLRLEVAEIDKSWRADVEREKEVFMTDARQKLGKEIVRLSQKVLMDLADADMQQQLIRFFVQKLQNLSAEEKQKLESALAEMQVKKIKLISSFEVPPGQQQDVVNAVNQYSSSAVDLDTEIDPSLLCGIKLIMPGGEFEWNVENYLTGIEDDLAKSLSAPASER